MVLRAVLSALGLRDAAHQDSNETALAPVRRRLDPRKSVHAAVMRRELGGVGRPERRHGSSAWSASCRGPVPELVERLESAFLFQRSLHETKTCLQELYRAVSEAYANTAEGLRANREACFALGGTRLLSQIAQAPDQHLRAPAPLAQPSGDRKPPTVSSIRNDCLSILRELSIGLQPASEALGADKPLLIHLFVLMRNRMVYDTAVALAEEVLAVRKETLDLGDIDDLPGLIASLTQLQLAYFCRVLALAVHEPEERLPLEQARRMTPAEALSYKKERQSHVVRSTERNHAILLGVPGLLPRLARLVRATAIAPHPFGPHEEGAQAPNLSEILSGIMSLDMDDETSEEEQEEEGEEGEGEEGQEREQPSAGTGGAGVRWAEPAGSGAEGSGRDSEGSRSPLRRRSGSSSGSSASGAEVGVRARQRRPRLRSRASQAAIPSPPAPVPGTSAGASQAPRTPEARQRILSNLAAVLETLSRGDAAALPLNIKALTVGAHQGEVLFVLCTLLGGRRKAAVQEAVGRAGLVRALEKVVDRLPWGKPEPRGHRHPFHAPHGPACECNPESAVKVQFLRVVHNFCDRDADWQAQCNKRLLLSPSERAAIASGRPARGRPRRRAAPPRSGPRRRLAGGRGRGRGRAPAPGLLTKMLGVLFREPDDSSYRFWLASCLESFLRGAPPRDQLFVARSGLMERLVGEVTAGGFRTAGALQAAFDLLGELVKFNRDAYEMLDGLLEGERFEAFMRAAVANLVDSNVFLRSALLSLYHFRSDSAALYQPRARRLSPGPARPGDHACAPRRVPVRPSSCPPRRRAAEPRGVLLLPPAPPPPTASAPRAPPPPLFPPPFPSRAPAPAPSSPSPLDLCAPHSPCVPPAAASPVCCRALPPSGASPDLSFERCRLTRFLDRSALLLLRDLMSVVSLRDINQDNVCCLNSALLLLMLANAQGLLPQYIAALRVLEEERGRPGSVCSNFRELLSFWTGYYQSRGKDCVSLEFSSNIKFSEWEAIVGLLCGEPGLPTSL
eukprot:tig00000828_g4628.t1